MSEKTIDEETIREEHLAEVHVPTQWLYLFGVLVGGTALMLVLIFVLSGGR
jgi:hypothetical protein